jgi:prolyl oligopeptidase
VIVHITPRAEWQRAQGEGAYRADTLASEGFIHCSEPHQVVRTADRYYRGRDGLVLLLIDEARLVPEIKREPSPEGELFPHVYGPLGLDAVVGVLDFPAGADGSFALPPPPSRVEPVAELLHGREVVDPYRWLEQTDAPAVRAWVAAQNAHTRAAIEGWPGFPAIRARLDDLLTAGSVSAPVPRRDRCFYQRRSGRMDQPVLLLREGERERTLLDPNALSASGTVALDWWYPSRDGRLLAYGLSEGGTELSTLRVLDVATAADLPDEQIPNTRACSVAWLPDGSGFYYTRYPAGDRYNRRVFLHRLGQPWSDDAPVFGEGRAPEDWPSVELSQDGRRLLVTVQQGWAKNELFLLDTATGQAEALHAGVDALAHGHFGGETLYLLTNEGAPNYRLLAVGPAKQRRELIAERPDRVLQEFRPVAGALVVEAMVDAASRLLVHDADGALKHEVALPALGSITSIHGEWDGDAAYVGYMSFAQPASAYRVDGPELRLFAEGELTTKADFVVDQVWYRSKDGTPVSMFLVHRPDLPLDGDNPTVLTGYGGFNIAMTPRFNAALPLWLEAGGVWALPNLRGGSEYGEAWHRGGMLGDKQNVFDDFAAAAEWLIEHKYTRPDRLGIVGGSNGGLLVGAALTQRPDLFGAVVCTVPLLDMLRYHTFLIARLWIAEYGSAEDPEQFAWLHAYSPYHRVRDGERYPAVFLLTAEGDSRVDPMHARKMAARLQAASGSGRPVLLRVDTEAGHGAGNARRKQLDSMADWWTFLFWQLGVDPSKSND